METITRLYPLPSQEMPLEGAYLAHDLRKQVRPDRKSFVYANFVTSLDGRIAVPRPDGTGLMVPKATANAHDWRLYQELAAQADLILSSGRYLREWAGGLGQEILQVNDPHFADLRQWREKNGLPPQADIAIISASLDFSVPPVLTAGGRKAVVVTTENADPARVANLHSQGLEVIKAGERSVDGARMVAQLSERGYRVVYSAAGPRVLYLLVAAGVLDRLYLTYVNKLLASLKFATFLEGPPLTPPAGLKIHTINMDPSALDGLGQLFVSYDRAENS